MKLQDILENKMFTYNPADLDKVLAGVLHDEGGSALMAAWNDGDDNKIFDALMAAGHDEDLANAAVEHLFSGKSKI